MQLTDTTRRSSTPCVCTTAVVVLAGLAVTVDAQEPVIGLPCEGCEAVFDALPDTLGSVARIAPQGEPGEPMRIDGTVRDLQGNPVHGMIVYAYHTDAHGSYPRDERLRGQTAYRHGRLRGWAKTDERGHYRFYTIRPASYPDGTTPAHVHMHVIQPGCCTYYVSSIHFSDDPRLSAEERNELGSRGGSGLVEPRVVDGTWVVTRDITLGKGVPGYSAISRGDRRQASDTSFLVTEPAWAPDGARLAFAGGVWPDLDIYVFDVATGQATRLFASDSTDYMPSWSPDGSRIVFASTRSGSHDLYVGSATRSTLTRLTADASCNNSEPDWSPDGNWIAYRSDCDGNREVYRISLASGERKRLTRDMADDGEPTWSPDGKRLLFTSDRDGQPDVFVMSDDGADVVRLTETPGGHSRRAEWSPDGTWIAFGSNRDGNEEVYVMRADGTGIRNVTQHPAREYYSRWSPDGDRLVFTSNRYRTRNAIYTTAVDGSDVRLLFPR
jgi:Tol biopolymer transport system component